MSEPKLFDPAEFSNLLTPALLAKAQDLLAFEKGEDFLRRSEGLTTAEQVLVILLSDHLPGSVLSINSLLRASTAQQSTERMSDLLERLCVTFDTSDSRKKKRRGDVMFAMLREIKRAFAELGIEPGPSLERSFANEERLK